MTEAEARRYLSQYRNEKSKIRSLEEQIFELRERRASVGSPGLDGMPHGAARDEMAEYAARLDALERELMEEKLNASGYLLTTIRAVNKVERKDAREILTLFYVRGYRWEDIAAITGYSRRHVLRKSGRAIRALIPVIENMSLNVTPKQ